MPTRVSMGGGGDKDGDEEEGEGEGPWAMIRPTPSWPPTCGSLMAVMGWPSGPVAVPRAVWRSVV